MAAADRQQRWQEHIPACDAASPVGMGEQGLHRVTATTYVGEMFGRAVPSILASTAPHSRWHAAQRARMAYEWIRVHGRVGRASVRVCRSLWYDGEWEDLEQSRPCP